MSKITLRVSLPAHTHTYTHTHTRIHIHLEQERLKIYIILVLYFPVIITSNSLMRSARVLQSPWLASNLAFHSRKIEAVSS